MALDVANIDIVHVKLDENNQYLEDVKSGLNDCFSLEANLDQTGRAFFPGRESACVSCAGACFPGLCFFAG
jgi:hypothetical protein